MSEMVTDLIQNIYSRISLLGKSIKSLQESLDALNHNMDDKVGSLVNSIQMMTESMKMEGNTYSLIFEQMGEQVVGEIKHLEDEIGLKDLDELSEKLQKIVKASEEALRPETVDVLLKEVLEGIRNLKEGTTLQKSSSNEMDLIAQLEKKDAEEALKAEEDEENAELLEDIEKSEAKDVEKVEQAVNLQIDKDKKAKEKKQKKSKLTPPPNLSPPPS
ncbi:MAG: hypothetical protein ACTSVU_00665 [Promethearchaeota archaeon]